MKTAYQIGKDLGKLRAEVKALARGRGNHATSGCQQGRSERRSSQLTPENLRLLRLIREKGEEIRQGIEEVFAALDVRPAQGGRLHLVAFSMVDPQDPAAAPMSPWGPMILACGADGTYDACFQIGCDPCAG
jgi:hypothetical protein